MKRHFHIGIRVDEIVYIGPSKSPGFPTAYTLRNGSSINTTGEWRDNMRKVEAVLWCRSVRETSQGRCSRCGD